MNADFFCDGVPVDSIQRASLLDFALDTRHALASEVQQDPAALFRLTYDPPVVEGKSVVAFTKLGPGNPIVIHQSAFMALSQGDAEQLVYHELGHHLIYSRLGGPVSDRQSFDGFSGDEPGFMFLNRFADCLGAYATHLAPYPAKVLQLSPYAYLRLNETEGAKALDASAGGRHGAYHRDVVFKEPGPLGGEDLAVKLRNTSVGQGTNHHGRIELGLTPEMVAPGRHVGIAFFYKRDRLGPREQVLVFTSSSSTERSSSSQDTLVSSPHGFGFSFVYGFPGMLETLSARIADERVSNGTWNHLVVNYCAGCVGNSDLYVNGVKESQGLPTQGYGGRTVLSFGWDIGMALSETEFWVDEIAIWDRALSSSEVRALYRAARPSVGF